MKTTTWRAALWGASVCAAAGLGPGIPITRAGVGDQLAKLTASDVRAGDSFGSSVAISGNTVLVGTFLDDDNGSDSGSAYLFDVTTGHQLAKLTASDAAYGDYFGYSVAISGNMALVGACYDDDVGNTSGSAYLFDATTGNQLGKLTASDGAVLDLFGDSVAISGHTALIGAFGDDDANGSAYLFDVSDPLDPVQLHKLTASDRAPYDNFGDSVAISGNLALVGAPKDDPPGSNSGSAYLFDVTTGDQLAKLTASDAAGYDGFGGSVAISGNTALVGAYGNDDDGSESGSAYLFDVSDPLHPVQLHKLTASDAAANDLFGFSVAISGNLALVGASNDDGDRGSDSGSAYLFDVATGEQLAELTASDAAAGDWFGYSVAISGNRALVGANGDNSYSGSAYLFSAAPEPGTLALALTGLGTIAAVRRRR